MATWLGTTETLVANLTGATVQASSNQMIVLRVPSRKNTVHTILIRPQPQPWYAFLAMACAENTEIVLEVVPRVESESMPKSFHHAVTGTLASDDEQCWTLAGSLVAAIAASACSLGHVKATPVPSPTAQTLSRNTSPLSLLQLAVGFALYPCKIKSTWPVGSTGLQADAGKRHVLILIERNRVTATHTNLLDESKPSIRVGYLHPAVQYRDDQWHFNGCREHDCTVDAIAKTLCQVATNAVSGNP